MKTTTLKTLNLLILTILLVGLAACNSRIPVNRPLITAGQEDTTTPPTDEIVTRPDGAVFFKSRICGCKDSVNILVPDPTCTSFCQGKNTSQQERLYTYYTVGPEIELGGLQNVSNWCTTDVGEDDTGVTCKLVAKTQIDDETIDIKELTPVSTISGDNNSLFFRLEDLEEDRTYVLTLVATSSAGTFKSDSTQIRKVSPGTGPIDLGPIALQPVSRYACINRVTQSTTDNGTELFYLQANLLHFYFIEQLRPDPLPQGIASAFCHNIVQNGPIDKVEFPRLFETAGAFTLWRNDDTRLLNLKTLANSGAGWSDNIDAEDIILQKLTALGVTPSTSRFFGQLNISAGPTLSTAGNSGNSSVPLGWYMRLFINESNNNIAVCPKQADYNGANKLFQAIGDVVQVDTEGIYLGKRESVTYVDPTDGSTKCVDDDFLIVKETQMRKVWFYYNNGVAIRPSNDTAGELKIKNNTMYFFYPYNEAAPTVKGASQKTYKIINPSQANTGLCSSTSGGVPGSTSETAINSSIAPHDKRFGCIPVTDSN